MGGEGVMGGGGASEMHNTVHHEICHLQCLRLYGGLKEPFVSKIIKRLRDSGVYSCNCHCMEQNSNS